MSYVDSTLTLLLLASCLLKNFDLSREQSRYLKPLTFNHKSEAAINEDAWYTGENVIWFTEHDQIFQEHKLSI